MPERTVGNISIPCQYRHWEDRVDEEVKSYWSRARLSAMPFVLLPQRAPRGLAQYPRTFSGHFPGSTWVPVTHWSLKSPVSLLPKDSLKKLLFFISFLKVFVILFWDTVSLYSLKLEVILLPLPLEFWDYRHALQSTVSSDGF